MNTKRKIITTRTFRLWVFASCALGLSACLAAPKEEDLVFEEATKSGAVTTLSSTSNNGGGSSNSGSGSNGSGTNGSGSNSTTQQSGLEPSLQMGNRQYLFSVFSQVFDLPGAPAENAIRNLILFDFELGGACDPYSLNPLSKGTFEFPDEQCSGINSMSTADGLTPVLPSYSSAARFALTANACELLVKDKTAFAAVTKKIYGMNAISDPNGTVVDAVYNLFFPIDPPSPEVKAALLDLNTLGGTPTQKFSTLLLTACLIPEWQAI